MTDLASLGLRIDSTEVEKGVGKLDQLSSSGAKAEAEINRLGGTAASTGRQVRTASEAAAQMAAQAQKSASGLGAMGGAAKLSRVQVLELGHVVTSLADSLAAGQNPARALFMEMGKIGQVASYSSGGITGLVKSLAAAAGLMKATSDAGLNAAAAAAEGAAAPIAAALARATSAKVAAQAEIDLGKAQAVLAATDLEVEVAVERLTAAHLAMITATREATVASAALANANEAVTATATEAAAAETVALAPLAVVVGAVAVAVGLAVGAFKLFQSQVKDSGEIKNYADSLGLTHKEMEKLKDVSVTFGDTMRGVWKTFSDATGAGKALTYIKDLAVDAFESILHDLKIVTAGIYAGFVGSYEAIKGAWKMLPAALGEATTNAANLVIAGVERMANLAIGGINVLIRSVNATVGTNIGTLGDVHIDRVKQNYAGAGKAAGAAFGKAYKGAYNDAISGMDATGAALWKNITDATKARLKTQADKMIGDRTPKKTSDTEALNIEAIEATIKSLYRLGDAYKLSSAEAFKAEAREKATADAIKKKGDVEEYYQRELRLRLAQAYSDAEKATAGINDQSAAQEAVNAAVAAGALPASQAARVLSDEAKLRPLITAAAVAEGAAKVKATQAIDDMTAAQKRANAAADQAAALASIAASDDELERLQLETKLISASNAQRAVELAQLAAKQALAKTPGADPATAKDQADKLVAAAVAQDALTTATKNYNDALSFQADLLDLIDQRAQTMAQSLGDAFGSVGNAIGGITTALTGYAATQEKLTVKHAADVKAAAGDAARIAQLNILYAKQSANAQVGAYLNVASAAKTLFKEHSAGYRAMEAAEKALAVVQLAQTAASVAAGAAKMFAQLGPFAFPAVAAMLAVMIGLGFHGGGGGGGGPSAADIQAAQGTGTILGDSTAKSASIAHSLDIMSKNSNADLEYSNAMVRSLRNIESGIGNLVGALARSLNLGTNANGLMNTGTTQSSPIGGGTLLGGALGGILGGAVGNFLNDIVSKIPVIGGILNAIGSFILNTKVTTKLKDKGIQFDPATIADIMANGIQGDYYERYKVKKKTSLFGIGISSSTKYKTPTTPLDGGVEDQVSLIIGSLFDSVTAAAKVLGLNVGPMLEKFRVDLGKISLMDLKGSEITDAIEAVFSKLGDQMAGFAVDGIEQFQKVGEGLFETLMRLAKDYTTVDVSLKSIGMTFGLVGASSVGAREALIDLFGTLDEFASETDYFRTNFLSEAEQMAPVISSVRDEMARLGLAGVTTNDQFKQAVLGLNLTTTAGQEMYAALLAVAPAFHKVTDYAADLNKVAGDGFQQTIDQFNAFADSLTKYRATLYAVDAAQGDVYKAARARFFATSDLASMGDATGLGNLQGDAKTFLDASMNHARTMLDYQRDVAAVAAGVDKGIFAAEATADYAQLQLDALNNSISLLTSINAGVSTIASVATGDPIPLSQVTVGAGEPAQSTSGGLTPFGNFITALLQVMRDQQTGTAQLAANTNKTNTILQGWDRGGAMATVDDAV